MSTTVNCKELGLAESSGSISHILRSGSNSDLLPIQLPDELRHFFPVRFSFAVSTLVSLSLGYFMKHSSH